MSKDTIQDQDKISRQRIVSETDSNFFVEAGAGSGKTSMLVERMVAMVEAGTDISKICAITFTKAAAGEFYERFRRRLIEKSGVAGNREQAKAVASDMQAEEAEIRRARCAEAVKNIDLCFMGTIDSFCSMILSEHPYEAGIKADSRVITNAEEGAVLSALYEDISNGLYGAELKEGAAAFHRMVYKDKTAFVTGSHLLYERRNAALQLNELEPEEAVELARTRFSHRKKEIVDVIKFIVEHPELNFGGKGSDEAWSALPGILHTLEGQWIENIYKLNKAFEVIGKLRITENALDMPAFAGDLLEKVRGKSYKLVLNTDIIMGELEDIRYRVCMTFLLKCVSLTESLLKKNGYLTFFDALFYLRNMLKKDAQSGGRLIRYIQKRHSYFLVDEFQDTNPLQAEICFYLAADDISPVWSECSLRPGSLFIVGDPKQSIYRFRGADVSSFMTVKKVFESKGGEILSLSRNFRSTDKLCGYFNDIFSKLLPEETPEQSRFANIPTGERKDLGFTGLFTYSATTKEDADRIADIITGITGRDDIMISDKATGQLRRINYDDIMVITKAKPKLANIKRRLDEIGVPVRVEGKVPFSENAALYEVSSIFAAITYPSDASCLFNVLTEPVFGCSEKELLRFIRCGGKLNVWKPFEDDADKSDKTAIKIAGKLEILQSFCRAYGGLAPSALFMKILDEFRIFEYVSSKNAEVLFFTSELLKGAETDGEVSTLADGVRFLENLINEETDNERCLRLDKVRRVHLANLHKVKGLEAPVVILAGAPSKTDNQLEVRVSSRIERKSEGAEAYIFDVTEERKVEKNAVCFFKTGAYKDIMQKEVVSERAEEDRLVYVAATRARNALIVCTDEKNKQFWKALTGTPLPDIFQMVSQCVNGDVSSDAHADVSEEPSPLTHMKQAYDQGDADCVLNERGCELPTYRTLTPSQLRSPSKLADDEKSETLPETQDLIPKRFANLLGTMIHRLMEIIVTSRGRADIAALTESAVAEFITPESKSYEKDFKRKVNEVCKIILGGGFKQSNGAPADIIKTLLEADEVYCEVPFAYKDTSGGDTLLIRGIMDVVYRNGDSLYIADYKTGADSKGLDEKYKEQLSAYKKAFKGMTGEEATAFVYHIAV